jgi:6-phosphogluconolactonase
MKNIKVFNTESELLAAVASWFLESGQRAIQERGRFNVALSGGNSPRKLYKLLSTEGYLPEIDWSKVFFFFGDERFVPEDDPQRNALMAKQTLFDPLQIPKSNIFTVDTSLSPEKAAEQYAETIATHFKELPVRFDLILLGLGENAHTASLFPFTPVLEETAATVKAVFLKDQNSYRISFTAPLINQARHIAFLVFGKGKAEAARHVLSGKPDPMRYPAQLINPSDGNLLWFMDAPAAANL